VTVAIGAATTITVEVSAPVGSAWLVAMTWNVPVVAAAVYSPEPEMVPPVPASCTVQST
jgi:hypothetical protein